MKKIIMVMLLIALLAFTACEATSTTETPTEDKIITPVKVTKIVEEETYRTLSNIGAVTVDEIVKVAFKAAGKLDEITVEKGDLVTEGMQIASLDASDYVLGLNAAGNQLSSAREAYNYAKDTYNRTQKLFDEGYASQDSFDQAKLNLDVRTSEYQQAQVNYQSKQNTINDTVIYAPLDGIIVDVLNQEGEIISAGYPIVIIRGEESVIKVGVPSDEIDKIKTGMACNITIDDRKSVGVIKIISELPDEATRNYEVVISMNDDHAKIGSLAKVSIPIERYFAIWIPIDTIMHKGDDYVFVVDDEIIVKKNIRILETQGNKARVSGLKIGDLMVTSNARLVKAGDEVSIQE